MLYNALYKYCIVIIIIIMKRKFQVMVNNIININKTNNHLSPLTITHKKYHDTWHWTAIYDVWLMISRHAYILSLLSSQSHLKIYYHIHVYIILLLVRVMVFNATFNNISVISWRSVLLVEETGVPRENQQPAASHWQTWSHNVVSNTPRNEHELNSQL